MPYDVKEQIEVEIPNKPGSLAALLQTLADAGVEVRAFCGYGMEKLGMVMLVPADAKKAKAALKKAGYQGVQTTHVVVATVKDRRGAGAAVAARAAKKRINLDYAYATGTGKGTGVVVLGVGKKAAALAKALSA